MNPNQHEHRGVVVTAYQTTWRRTSTGGTLLGGPYLSWQAVVVLPGGQRARCGLRRTRAQALAWGIERINRAFRDEPMSAVSAEVTDAAPVTIPVPDFFEMVSPCALCGAPRLVYATEDDTVRCAACHRRWGRHNERTWLLVSTPPTGEAVPC